MYASPESLAISYHKKYILAEVLSKLGEKLNAEMVFVDLRAGLSEFSAPLLFDPRVKKYLVTSTSYQSVKGTEILLQQLSKGLPLDGTSKIPEILLTMVQDGLDITEIKSELVAVYDQYISDESISVTDDIVTELPFVSELVHLESLAKIMKNLDGKEYYKNILKIVENSYIVQKETVNAAYKASREKMIERIHDFAENQMAAEGNGAFDVLMTDTIQNLIKKYKNTILNTVIMGAKGSGKTFLYREILRNGYWEKFIMHMNQNSTGTNVSNDHVHTLTIPLLALDKELNKRGIQVVFLIDGLEEIFSHTISSENEKNAITALCRDFVDEMKIAYQNLGLYCSGQVLKH
jgi:hypothetical protein